MADRVRGIQQTAGKPAVCEKKSIQKKPSKDVRINDFEGGKPLEPSTKDGQVLSDVWKGCSQGSNHATNETNHPSVNDAERCEALKILLEHLQNTIYKQAGRNIRDFVLTLK